MPRMKDGNSRTLEGAATKPKRPSKAGSGTPIWEKRPARDLAKAAWDDSLGPYCGSGKPGGGGASPTDPRADSPREVVVLVQPQGMEKLGNRRDWGRTPGQGLRRGRRAHLEQSPGWVMGSNKKVYTTTNRFGKQSETVSVTK